MPPLFRRLHQTAHFHPASFRLIAASMTEDRASGPLSLRHLLSIDPQPGFCLGPPFRTNSQPTGRTMPRFASSIAGCFALTARYKHLQQLKPSGSHPSDRMVCISIEVDATRKLDRVRRNESPHRRIVVPMPVVVKAGLRILLLPLKPATRPVGSRCRLLSVMGLIEHRHQAGPTSPAQSHR